MNIVYINVFVQLYLYIFAIVAYADVLVAAEVNSFTGCYFRCCIAVSGKTPALVCVICYFADFLQLLFGCSLTFAVSKAIISSSLVAKSADCCSSGIHNNVACCYTAACPNRAIAAADVYKSVIISGKKNIVIQSNLILHTTVFCLFRSYSNIITLGNNTVLTCFSCYCMELATVYCISVFAACCYVDDLTSYTYTTYRYSTFSRFPSKRCIGRFISGQRIIALIASFSACSRTGTKCNRTFCQCIGIAANCISTLNICFSSHTNCSRVVTQHFCLLSYCSYIRTCSFFICMSSDYNTILLACNSLSTNCNRIGTKSLSRVTNCNCAKSIRKTLCAKSNTCFLISFSFATKSKTIHASGYSFMTNCDSVSSTAQITITNRNRSCFSSFRIIANNSTFRTSCLSVTTNSSCITRRTCFTISTNSNTFRSFSRCTTANLNFCIFRCQISSHSRCYTRTGHYTCSNQHCQQFFSGAAFSSMAFCHFGNNHISITRFTPDNLKDLVHKNIPPNILKN